MRLVRKEPTLIEKIAERFPELHFKRLNDYSVVRVVTDDMEATEAFCDGKLYRIIVQVVD